MQADSNTKNPAVAGALALVGGPLGFLYVGWRYALAAAVVFLSFIFVFTFLLPVPSWFKYVNLPVFAFMAYRICDKLNGLADRGQHRGALASHTLPVAVFAMTSMLPLLAGFDSAVLGVVTAIPQFLEGDLSSGLLMLLLVTPLFVVLNFVLFLLIGTGIDRAVIKIVPAAPRYIFRPAINLGE
jgi:hypothetical protein